MDIKLTPLPESPKNNEGPKIKLPEDAVLIMSLKDKLSDYEKRFEKKKMEGASQGDLWDVIYKIVVLDRLLEYGEVDLHKISVELKDKYGSVYEKILENAHGVIEAYIKQDNKKLHGGTGIKSKEEIVKNTKQEALERFPNSQHGQELAEKEILGTISPDEKIALRAVTRFPDGHRSQELAEKEIRGTITEKEKSELRRCEIFPKDEEKDVRDLLRDDELGTIHKEEGAKLKEFVLGALRQNGLLLQYVSPRLKNDKTVVLRAIEQNPEAFQFASVDLQNNSDVRKAAKL